MTGIICKKQKKLEFDKWSIIRTKFNKENKIYVHTGATALDVRMLKRPQSVRAKASARAGLGLDTLGLAVLGLAVLGLAVLGDEVDELRDESKEFLRPCLLVGVETRVGMGTCTGNAT